MYAVKVLTFEAYELFIIYCLFKELCLSFGCKSFGVYFSRSISVCLNGECGGVYVVCVSVCTHAYVCGCACICGCVLFVR